MENSILHSRLKANPRSKAPEAHCCLLLTEMHFGSKYMPAYVLQLALFKVARNTHIGIDQVRATEPSPPGAHLFLATCSTIALPRLP